MSIPEEITKEYLLDLLWYLVDTEQCQWDHNHSCQMHGYFYIPQGDMCPHEEARQVLKREGIDVG